MDHYNAMNDSWLEIITSSSPRRYEALEKRKLKMFFMASYNLEAFKAFVFSSSFLQLFEVERETAEEISRDEVELMKFACRWMKFSLFGEATVKVKEEIVKARKEKSR